ncbi:MULTISPECIES: diguanylate cyclase [Sulfurimonas]|uniref:sensor domain-containing diguanylate cyclase n=1 Tax=Sulfurimonas TaxID=202746 RepID=UPI001265439B|nr:diguanylate cyclase [Sulfurimonas indica]
MTSYNTVYTNEAELQRFIELHELEKEERLFVQIFSGIVDAEYCLELAGVVKERLPKANIIGTTTSGEICNGAMYDNTVTLSFSIFNKTSIKSKLYQLDKNFHLEDIQKELLSDNTKAMIIFSDGLKSDAETLLKDIYKMAPDIVIAGGRAADKSFKQTYVFTEKEYSDNGCVIATLSGDELFVNSDYILKWTPIGKEMSVTKADGSTLYELDGIAIIDVYRKYLGDDVVNNLPASCMAFPLLLDKEGVLVARDPVAVTENHALMYAGKFDVGDSVRFSFANIEELTDNLYEYFEKIKTKAAEAVYIYSCAARKALLEDKLRDEINILESLAPTVGFFTFGEYFHAGKIAELLNVTTTFMLLSETKKSLKEKRLITVDTKDFDPIKKALTHLVKVTTKELENLSTHDALTSLYNRSEYLQTIKRKIKSAQRYGSEFGLILVDIDFFKLVNDNYGHKIGDEVLKRFAKVLQKNVREDDFVARWGGEEFIIIANYTNKEGLVHLVEKLQKKIAKVVFSPVPKITASFGLTTYKKGDDYEELFKRVDNALYMAKHNGRDQYIIG